MDSATCTAKKLPTLKKKRNVRADVPSSDDPRVELHRLVREHYVITKRAVAFQLSVSDKKDKATGKTIQSAVPGDVKLEVMHTVATLKKRADTLITPINRQLRGIPIYSMFLGQVYGLGPLTSAYLVSEIDIHKATKISNLRRFCGMAVNPNAKVFGENGNFARLERPQKGIKLGYNKELRTRLYQAFSAMLKNSSKIGDNFPYGVTSKYLEIWYNYIERMRHSERYDKKTNTLLEFDTGKPRKGAAAVIYATGWHKACDVLLEDMYVVWRALEGLPVWPSYYAAKLGFEHHGKYIENAPKLLTVEEALEIVGFVGSVPLQCDRKSFSVKD